MRPKYKKVKVSLPHCPKCGERLLGNNSIVSPYHCSCGVWKNTFENPLEYKIIKK